jgi:hypothetical protein
VEPPPRRVASLEVMSRRRIWVISSLAVIGLATGVVLEVASRSANHPAIQFGNRAVTQVQVEAPGLSGFPLAFVNATSRHPSSLRLGRVIQLIPQSLPPSNASRDCPHPIFLVVELGAEARVYSSCAAALPWVPRLIHTLVAGTPLAGKG